MAAGDGRHIFPVLLRSENILQNGAELNLPQNTAGFHVAKHLFQVPDPLRQRLHFPKAAVNLFQPLIDQPEGLGHAVIQGLLQLFVDSLTHFVKFGIIVLPYCGKLTFH